MSTNSNFEFGKFAGSLTAEKNESEQSKEEIGNVKSVVAVASDKEGEQYLDVQHGYDHETHGHNKHASNPQLTWKKNIEMFLSPRHNADATNRFQRLIFSLYKTMRNGRSMDLIIQRIVPIYINIKKNDKNYLRYMISPFLEKIGLEAQDVDSLINTFFEESITTACFTSASKNTYFVELRAESTKFTPGAPIYDFVLCPPCTVTSNTLTGTIQQPALFYVSAPFSIFILPLMGEKGENPFDALSVVKICFPFCENQVQLGCQYTVLFSNLSEMLQFPSVQNNKEIAEIVLKKGLLPCHLDVLCRFLRETENENAAFLQANAPFGARIFHSATHVSVMF